MKSLAAVTGLFSDITAPVIQDWVARGWVHVAGASPEEWVFAEIDVARVRLIRELRIDLDVDEKTLPLVLSLMDQVYDLRRAFKAMARALEGQPAEVRAAVLAAITDTTGPQPTL
jgi:chaperone modulatory protein CbpM